MRGLLAIEPLYHQIVAGRKTQTRRSGGLQLVNESPENWEITGDTSEKGGIVEIDFCDFMDTQRNIHCAPRYKVGEVLYLKEPYREPVPGTYWYKFTMYPNNKVNIYDWSNKLFMPASAARAFIRITGIKCERLLDISDEDCIAEGIEVGSVSFNGEVTTYINYLMHEGYGYDYIDNTPKQSFISLYKLANKLAKVGSVPPHGSILAPPGVDNIWVWAYTFEYLNYYKL